MRTSADTSRATERPSPSPKVPTAPGFGRRLLTWSALLAMAVAAVVGSNVFSLRDRLLGSALPDQVVPAASRVVGDSRAEASPDRTALRSSPWWQTVIDLEGTGNTTSAGFTIDARATDWRVTWSCTAGHLRVQVPGDPLALVDADCPQGVGHSERRGLTRLEVTAGGPWRVEVAQRIDTPLVEPPLPAMTAPGTTVLATGSFYKVDKVGAGSLSLYGQADGGYSVRLDDFWVNPGSSLQLRLSTAEEPRSSQDYLNSESQLLSTLDVTAGSLNYTAPVGVDPDGFRSVVVWSPSDNSVYAAARLEAP